MKTPEPFQTLPAALSLHDAAGDAVAGVAGRLARVIVGVGVDHERGAVVVEERIS